MIQIQYMKPFYTKVTGDKLRLVFAFQYFTISKDSEVFHFIPIEGKEMIINMKTSQIENLSEVFVFQRGNRFIRMPLYQLMLASNMLEYLDPIIANRSPKQYTDSTVTKKELTELIEELEKENLNRLVNQALLDNDKTLFFELLQHRRREKEDV